MLTVKKIINNKSWKTHADDEIVLDHIERNKRRISLESMKKIRFLLDEARPVNLCNGALLILTNNYRVKVKAKSEKVFKIQSTSNKELIVLAWHIGNRHIPAEIHKDYILIKRDEVIGKMLKSLGAKIFKRNLSFTPQSGAYHNL